MTVSVITDTAASLPPELADEAGVWVVPLALVIGGTDYHDGELPLDEVLARLDEGVTTSGASPGEFSATIEEALAGSDEAVVITIASAMSGTYKSACVAADDVGSRVRVVDSETAAGAEALVVLAAAEVARAGGSVDEVEAEARRVASLVRLVATVDSLDRLVESGRVPNIAGLAGKYLGVNPLFEFRQGKVRPQRPAFSRDAALDRIIQQCRASRPREGGRLRAAALHAADESAAEHLLAAVSEAEEPAEAFVGSFTPVMVAHTGPGLAGLAWWWDTA